MNFTAEETREYRQALEEQVCSICRETGYGDSCKVGEQGVCPVEYHLPRILEAVLSTRRSRYVADYLPKLRELVCAHCENQDARGVCKARDLAECGVDSFMLLVAETVEEVHDRLRSSKQEQPK